MRALNGEVAEWSKAHAWKACNGQPFESSNLSLTAILISMSISAENRTGINRAPRDRVGSTSDG
jgi:hypothetical protein